MASYSVLLTNGFRADCTGKRISQAIKQLADKRPDLIPLMIPSFITYINGISSYGFRQTPESRKTVELLRKRYLESF
jgi:hypothetical protein